MAWSRFAVWNIAGALAWGVGIGLAAYYAGAAVIDTIQRDATVGIGIVVILVVALVCAHIVRGRVERS